MATLLDPALTIDDADGNPITGASLYFDLTGTTTPATVYSDNGLTTPILQPVTTDAAGRAPYVYLDPAVTYRMKAYDADGVLIPRFSPDPLNPTGTTGTAAIADGSVSTAKLATGAVTTVKIADGNVSNAKLADMAAGTLKGRAPGGGSGVPSDLAGLPVPAPSAGDVTALNFLLATMAWGALATITGTASAYEISVGNLRIKGGVKSASTDNDTITYSNAMPTATLFCIAWATSTSADTQSGTNSVRLATQKGSKSTTGFAVYLSSEEEVGDVFRSIGGVGAASITYDWLALGH